MPRAKRARCELAARLRERHERTGRTRPRKFAYWRGQVRLCRRVAIASVRFVGQARDLKLCRECFDREAYEHPDQWLEFNMLESYHLEDAKRRAKAARTRAPEERSFSDVPRRQLSRAEWLQLQEAGLDPSGARQIGDLLRQEWRELDISGASAPEGDSDRAYDDDRDQRAAVVSRRAHRNSP